MQVRSRSTFIRDLADRTNCITRALLSSDDFEEISLQTIDGFLLQGVMYIKTYGIPLDYAGVPMEGCRAGDVREPAYVSHEI